MRLEEMAVALSIVRRYRTGAIVAAELLGGRSMADRIASLLGLEVRDSDLDQLIAGVKTLITYMTEEE